MFLKTLTLAGFKSFADRTRLDFEPGVNVVVGPNGSGKSNIVDAVAWVLGTRATSSLRTEKMEDVIFSGTATRPAHRRAEVTLTLDNAERRLPLDLPEVSLTRRLYRDGTSEYLVNGAACRLLDIQELLADSGVGRHQHVIVGQGRIGAILTASPEEHRAVIEEAAGVVKHRQRRDRSLRRLEQTEIDIARLQDILGEQQRRMRPLRRQANAYRRYDGLRAEVRALRLYLGGEQLRSIRSRLDGARAEEHELEAQLEATAAELAELTASLGDHEHAAGSAGRALERDTAAAARLETAAERLHRVAMVARERRMARDARVRGAGERRRDLEQELSDLTAAAAADSEEERAATTRAAGAEAALRALEDEERSLAEQAQLPAEGVVASLRGDLQALEAAAMRDGEESAALRRRLEVLAAQAAEEAARTEGLVADIRATDSEVARAQASYQDARAGREKDQEAWDRAAAALHEARVRTAGDQARVEAFDAAAHGLADPAVREQVAAARQVTGTLAAALDVPDDLAPAIDAALGQWADAYVAAGTGDVAAVVADLKSSGLGGVPIVAAADTEAAAPARDVAAGWGVDALLDRLGSAADQALAAALLGDTVIVEGWAAGWDLVRRHPGIRAVTPEGDLIAGNGIRPAVPDGVGPAGLEAAHAALEAAETEEARAESLHTQTRRAFEASRAAERKALEALETLEARLAGATEALAVIERSIAAGREERARLEDRSRALAEAEARRTERLAALRQGLAEFDGDEADAQDAWEALQRRRSDVAQRRAAARRAAQEAAGALAAVGERRKLTADRRATIEAELDRPHDHAGDVAEVERLAGIEGWAREAVDVVRGHVATLRERQRHLRVEAGDAGSRLEEAQRRRRSLEQELIAGRERSSELRVALAELAVRLESVGETLRRDADTSEEEACAAPEPEVPAGVGHADHLATLESQLRRIGPVNPLAAAEYEELKERAEFLEGQLADLEESHRELRKVISALDDEIATLFRQAFEDIDRAYQENFALLFPGGKGRVRLTDPDAPLITGVELEAQPLGKRISRLSLLSGGERALAALAFLFAVFRARPSPFYLLDEVEAALDDSNLHRFLRLVESLRGSAQLTIITHQQQTMEAGDILYGVTMEPGESSLVLAKRLSEVREPG